MKTKCCDCCYPQVVNSKVCGCCEGIGIVTTLSTANRPGLSQLVYRIGTHSSFLETMIARLSSNDYPALKGLSTRDKDDPSIALLDSWATVADVLTFYQERIANEGYLHTATERRSVLELARLVGYRLRPGVSSSVFLAYTIDDNTKEEVTIPIGTRAQSVPGPDELPQSFETSEILNARARWNNLKPRLTQPQTSESIKGTSEFMVQGPRVYLKGINTNLKPNDPLLIDFGPEEQNLPAEPELPHTPKFGRIKDVYPDAINNRTLVTFQKDGESEGVSDLPSSEEIFDDVQLIQSLTQRPSFQPSNSLKLKRNLAEQFNSKGNTGYEVASAFVSELGETLTAAARNATATPTNTIKVYALRVNASLFGHNAPREPQYEPSNIPGVEFSTNPMAGNLKPQPWDEWKPDGESENALHLDRAYDQLLSQDYIVIQKINEERPMVFKSTSVQTVSRSAYGLSGETTRIILNGNWNFGLQEVDIREIRTTRVYAQTEELELAEEPIETVVCGGEDDPIELDDFYEGLESGRWVIVSGERDIEGTSGVRFSELAMLSSVTQDLKRVPEANSSGEPRETQSHEKNKVALPGDKIHTFITLAEELAYCFKRDTVTIYGNVVKATHGETRQEILGSGNGSKALQAFNLKQFPLTHVSASNPTGVDSTLEVLINDIQWHETDTLVGLGSHDRRFITKTNDEDKTTIMFGNGKEGARLPTGIENIRAQYRNGIGKSGNVKARQISLLASKPLGVKEVINPLRASGGANRESREQARKNVPLAVKALDRLVSVQDYEDFSRVYAGIGKAHAVELSDGRRQLVHVTIAGAEDIPIDLNSDLYRNLRQALHEFGDPHQPIQLAIRELMFMVVSARVKILSDYRWETVASDLRRKLLDAFSFERRELGQDVVLSEIVSVMQAVRGVGYVDIDAFGGIPEKKALLEEEQQIFTDNDVPIPFDSRRLLTPEEIVTEVLDVVKRIDQNVGIDKKEGLGEKEGKAPTPHRLVVNQASREGQSIRPAQIAFLSPDIPDTLILNQIT